MLLLTGSGEPRKTEHMDCSGKDEVSKPLYDIIPFSPQGLDRSLLYSISQLPVRVFTEVAIATAVDCWNWLLTKRPDLEYPVSVYMQACVCICVCVCATCILNQILDVSLFSVHA